MVSFDGSIQVLQVVLFVLIYTVAIVAAVDALFSTPSSQGAIAWVSTLILFPYLGLPLYLVFGRRWLRGYKKLSKKLSTRKGTPSSVANRRVGSASTDHSGIHADLEKISNSQFSAGNRVEFLVEGSAFYAALLDQIAGAKEQVLLCFYLVHADTIGQRLKESLIDAAQRGVEVKFLYDRIGSFPLPSRYGKGFIGSGVEFVPFNSDRTWRSWFHLNFRNHRKIAVIDRMTAFIGGFNVGDEYLGLSKEIGAWRDTQVRIEGPVVADIIQVFQRDWEIASDSLVGSGPVSQKVESPKCGDVSALIVSTGPADQIEVSILFLLAQINSATSRIWISSPYFVPDESILMSLALAACRGVDVRVVIPGRSDQFLAQLATLYHSARMARGGIRVYSYTAGFMHQKALLIDDRLATISSANMDNRSLRLNFEISLTLETRSAVDQLAELFERDFLKCTELRPEYFDSVPFLRRVAYSFARLLGPIL